ncbi:hypothetical protein GC209_12680 [bacterium]|nr:hypothetical protein [bacterium]
MTRRWLAPRLDRGAGTVKTLAEQIGAGRFAMSWLGKAARHLPRRESVSEAVACLATRMSEARLLLQPPPAAPQPLAYPDLIRPAPDQAAQSRPAQVQPGHASPPSGPDADLAAALARKPRGLSDPDPAVQAIRAMMQAQASAPSPLPASARFLPIGPQEPTVLMRIGAHAIAWGSLTLALPIGLVQAGWYHLNGGDLKDWD